MRFRFVAASGRLNPELARVSAASTITSRGGAETRRLKGFLLVSSPRLSVSAARGIELWRSPRLSGRGVVRRRHGRTRQLHHVGSARARGDAQKRARYDALKKNARAVVRYGSRSTRSQRDP